MAAPASAAAMAAAASQPAAEAQPAPAAQRGSSESQLEYLCRQSSACVLRPYCFFVSWQGVLTLAYRGFPPALVGLKEQLADYYDGLPKESPGSRWPKTSLACVQEGKRLTPQQLARLNELCRQHSGVFQAPGAVKAQAVLVNSLSVVIYETRCLERVISRQVLPLASPPDLAGASPEELARVQGVVAEADDDDYWFHASRDGNREKHYRSPALGATLVHELACFRQQVQPKLQQTAADAAAPGSGGNGKSAPGEGGDSGGGSSDSSSSSGVSSAWGAALPGILSKFRAAVEAGMPGLYAWFDDESLHVTIRAIIL